MLVIDHAVLSPNYNKRPNGIKPSAIVLHTTEGNWPSDLRWLCDPQASGKYKPVSCHYVISPAAKVYQIVPDELRAWHAGVGSYLGIANFNDISIGIEVSHVAGRPWADGQLDVLAELCRSLIEKYSIQKSRIVAHRWIAPERRKDPTDFDNEALVAWIERLYTVDYAAAWSRPDYDRVAGFGITAKWREHYQELGKCLTDELSLIDGRVYRVFERGFITHSDTSGSQVYMTRKP